MNVHLESELKKITDLARAENYEAALRRIDQLAAEWPNEPKIWAERAFVNERQGDREAALCDLARTIALCNDEPHHFYIRGILLFQLGRYDEAICDFTKVLELCDYHKSNYYRSPAHFFRADAYLRLKQYKKAKADCEHVRDDMCTWTDRLRTKADILAECGGSPSG
jgi:tetratricopeptide (TPR) repeat protein